MFILTYNYLKKERKNTKNKRALTNFWKWDIGSVSYPISSLLAPFFITGRSPIASRTVIVRYGAVWSRFKAWYCKLNSQR